jgi:hypothetical protein
VLVGGRFNLDAFPTTEKKYCLLYFLWYEDITLIFREDTFIYFFVVPAGLIILFNSYVLVQAFREAL